jgi:hypothetical protein
MRREIYIFALLCVFLLQFSNAFAQEKTKLRISSATKTLGYGPLWVASKMAFFERQRSMWIRVI